MPLWPRPGSNMSATLTRRRSVAFLAGLAATAASPAWAAKKAWPAAPGDMNLGNSKARVHVVEYMSLTCGHCAQFNAEVFPAFKAKYIDTGQVFYTARELLTAPQQLAVAGVLMARCNGGTRYFPIIDQVLRSQSRWQGGNIKAIFLDIAKANGLSEAQFEACLLDEAALRALEARVQYATDTDKVNSTPTFFVNGVRLAGDRVPDMADLDAAIARALTPKSGGGR
jgi:protein-disulfide isomerase